MKDPLVTIVIPVYNGENYLGEAIDSALEQTYKNVEIIVVNDGSSDNTEKVALSYGAKIRYFYKENGGVSTALNLAIQEMKGEYFSWLSHDDIYYPNKIEKQIKALHEHKDMSVIVHSDYDLLDSSSGNITHLEQSKIYDINQLTNSVFPVLQGLIQGCTLLIHRSHFERVGVFDEDSKTQQDYDLWFRMLRKQKSIYISEPLISVRLHGEQGSRTLSNYYSERELQFLKFAKELTEEEMTEMYGSPYDFYHKMYCFFKGGNMEKAYRYVNEKFQEAEVPNDMSKSLSHLSKYIKDISSGKTDCIAIFGAGEYGIRLYHELRGRLIKVDFFSDNNPEKYGYLFDDVYCISPQELLKEKQRTLVIVANRAPTAILNQLKSMEFPYVITKQEIDKLLIDVHPVKWASSLDSLEEVDYTSKDVSLLIKRFNETIYDICKYYEDRLQNR